ncbi:hypothetical protein F4553_002094 [Allocatelliglobosispora scoriae]|uniref:Uncharacterized protein n=1 Tax=Allocatelliglobosispora scoriae TaxID=643052 RepID=A0A841BM31_9ACTN|nr:hypothetical protein [Allocatelliglobosispora scoriae]MBB5868715.1 hypothetical protein [Allocatelliglobosispora scoriae]
MPRPNTLRVVLIEAAVAGLLVVGWQVGTTAPAVADVTETASVSAGPNTFSQTQPTGNPSQYDSQLERCHTGPSYPPITPNPILAEPLTTAVQSNLPISVKVVFEGNQWYGTTKLVFTNRSAASYHVDCAVIIFRGPSNADQHYYFNSAPTGHPQSDYLEVKKGDGTSFYIVRLGFHDVPLAQRTTLPGGTFAWQIGGAPAANLSLAQIRDSIRFYGDLNLAANTGLVQKYATQRLAN